MNIPIVSGNIEIRLNVFLLVSLFVFFCFVFVLFFVFVFLFCFFCGGGVISPKTIFNVLKLD